MKKSKAGGARPGAGRPKGEEKEALGLRVPKKLKSRLASLVKVCIKNDLTLNDIDEVWSEYNKAENYRSKSFKQFCDDKGWKMIKVI